MASNPTVEIIPVVRQITFGKMRRFSWHRTLWETMDRMIVDSIIRYQHDLPSKDAMHSLQVQVRRRGLERGFQIRSWFQGNLMYIVRFA